MHTPDPLPCYHELPVQPGAPPHSAWGVFGDDDGIGTINLMTPRKALEAAQLVRTGRSFPLNWGLEEPQPTIFGRGLPRHRIFGGDHWLDDVLDNFYPQSSSQWDGLNHIRHPKYGFYNGVTMDQITGKPGTRNGVEQWARRGMATRGVLVDVARHFAKQGRPVTGTETVRFDVDDLDATLAAQGVEIGAGDVLLVRTGWMGWYLNASPAERQEQLGKVMTNGMPGLKAGRDMAAWIWDMHLAAVAADNVALEARPVDVELGSLHNELLPLLGIAIGEMFFLEDLASDCADDGVYEFMFTSAPLNLLGAVGSPANALAIK